MKFLLLGSLSIFAFSATAQDFNFKKQDKLDYVDQKIMRLHEYKGCLKQASDEEALRDCKREKEEDMEYVERTKKKDKKAKKQKQEPLTSSEGKSSEEEVSDEY